jgi:hypothetical protein
MSEPVGGAPERDRYPDALRAGALLVVVLGHWTATLPRLEDGRMVATEHLLQVWDAAGLLTWVLQVVPLFVFVSAAVTSTGVARRIESRDSQLRWWSARALAMARPTVTYMAVLTVMVAIAHYSGGRLLTPESLTPDEETLRVLHKTIDGGINWAKISPDVTAYEPDKQTDSGEPITRDMTGEEVYSAIYAMRASRMRKSARIRSPAVEP